MGNINVSEILPTKFLFGKLPLCPTYILSLVPFPGPTNVVDVFEFFNELLLYIEEVWVVLFTKPVTILGLVLVSSKELAFNPPLPSTK